jgi:tRNA-splicing ligase RtcB (3'-phosphate/5'-hydroxy nucleic acid ligase)
MDRSRLTRTGDYSWRIERQGAMRAPAVIYANEALIDEMDEKVYEQIANVAAIPGIVGAAYAMPDAHWGYGFPIGGVAAFDAEAGGIVSAGGVGFDISCGVRLLTAPLTRTDIQAVQQPFAHELSRAIPAGLGSTGRITLDDNEMDAMLAGGARWAVEQGFGEEADLDRIEERGRMAGADPAQISLKAHQRQRHEMGTLGSGNHCAVGGRDLRAGNGCGFRPEGRSGGGDDPLRLTRARPSDRHGVSSRNGHRRR